MATVHPPTQGDSGAASRWREAALGAICLVLGAALLWMARSIELPARAMAVSPRIWPEALAYGIMGLSVLQIVSSFVSTPKVDDDDEEEGPVVRSGIVRVVGFVLATVAFGFLWYFVHFLVSGLVFVAALTWIAGGRGLKDLVLFPAGVTVLIYVLFGLLLRVPL
ncbi:tripartite tricarboxylate transporter TctB family protein [Micromonospora fluostatini]|uniref:Tripartite tricarboxylate transporter TctB family protein n=1 Tax=Micromonospora fluostatini TaxID=1629071 RepID=A0ABY2DK68_9ACTN|nr:tripartite tricarboxylate transporter TctB family protein [Micromonospora fluostatini]